MYEQIELCFLFLRSYIFIVILRLALPILLILKVHMNNGIVINQILPQKTNIIIFHNIKQWISSMSCSFIQHLMSKNSLNLSILRLIISKSYQV